MKVGDVGFGEGRAIWGERMWGRGVGGEELFLILDYWSSPLWY